MANGIAYSVDAPAVQGPGPRARGAVDARHHAPSVPQHIAEQVEVRDGHHAIEVSALFEDAVLEVRHLSGPSGGRRNDGFTIGPDPRASFIVPGDGLPAGRFPLVRPAGTEYELCFTAAMTGDAQLAGKRHALSELSASGQARVLPDLPGAFGLPLQHGVRCNLRLGEATFNVISVPRPRSYPVPLTIDWGTQAYTGAVFAAVSLFLLLIFSVPPDPKSLSLDAFLKDNRLISLTLTPPQIKEDTSWLNKQDQPQGGQHSAKGPSGKTSHADKPVSIARSERPLSADQLKTTAQIQARTAGVLGALAANDAVLNNVLQGGSALSRGAADALDGLTGTEVVDGFGPGMGIVGSGRDGGGLLDGPIGIGRINTSGIAGGNREYGNRVGQFKQRTAHAPDPVIGQVEVRGSLDKELIRRIIRQHINEVKFCYERELTRNAGLAGRVVVQFTISPTGVVPSSVVQSSTMGNPMVEQCIAGSVRRWQFPRPQGGIVIASYPFVLKPAE